MLKLEPLFSGSKGNCTLIRSDNINILLDAGYSHRATVQALRARGVEPQDVGAVLITHEHSDHIAALPMWNKCMQLPVYVPQPIADYIGERSGCRHVVGVSGGFDLADVHVDVYECSHDAQCCYGYRFTCGGQSVACVTDTGCATHQLAEFLAPCRSIMLESNHDVDMLLRGDYSYPLKLRILSDRGHLSNAQAADLLHALVGSQVKNVVLAHLSEKNNTKELAFSAVVNMYAACGVTEGRDVCVYVADQYANEVSL